VLVEAFAAYPEGERARIAWEGVQALQALGINVSVPQPDGVRRTVPLFQLRETWEAVPDGVGSRATYARGQDRYGVWLSIALEWNDQAGVKDGFTRPFSRQEWQEFHRHNTDEGIVLVQVPPDYARWQIDYARRINQKSGFPLEDHLEDWDELVGPPPEDYQPPDPLSRLRALPPERLAELEESVDVLFEHPPFEAWGLEPADLQPWFAEWQQLMNEEIPDDVFSGRREALLRGIVREKVTPAMAELYHDRLLDAARKFESLDWQDQRDLAATVVLQMETGLEPPEIPFFQELAENGLSMLEEMLEGGEDPEGLRYDPMRPLE